MNSIFTALREAELSELSLHGRLSPVFFSLASTVSVHSCWSDSPAQNGTSQASWSTACSMTRLPAGTTRPSSFPGPNECSAPSGI